MATYQRKALTVEARVYDGPKLTVVSDEKGIQTANPGDYLIGTERGKVTVMTKADFEKDYEAAGTEKAAIVVPGPVVAHFDTIGEAQDYVTANVKAGDEFQFTVGSDPTIQTAQ
jgi:hypothetical protein